MNNKLIKIIVIALAAIGLVAIFALVGMGVMMYWMMGNYYERDTVKCRPAPASIEFNRTT